MDLRNFLFRYRSYTPLPLLFVSVLFAQPTTTSLICGAIVALFGECIRMWGVRSAGPRTRTTSAPGGEFLVTHGAFAYVRNPIYIGNIIMYTGIALMTNIAWLPVVAFAYFFIQYALIISAEEEYLRATFGAEYEHYFTQVQRYIPRFTPYPSPIRDHQFFDLITVFHSEARTFQAITVCFVLMSALAYWRG